jgi:hypothetical protein
VWSVLRSFRSAGRLLWTVAETDSAVTRLGIGDLNHDGAMDIVYAGGLGQPDTMTRI